MNKQELALKIAMLSASQDQHGEWWGDDTTLGDLPGEIVKLLNSFPAPCDCGKLREALEWIRSRCKQLDFKDAVIQIIPCVDKAITAYRSGQHKLGPIPHDPYALGSGQVKEKE